jgi:hypothetical protein
VIDLYYHLEQIFWLVEWGWGCDDAEDFTLNYLWDLLWDCPYWLAVDVYNFLEPIILDLCYG